ncbi:redoxin domain-containing protein [Candidatus Berkelbacteria bacterium]|nr:redoxin domain-containing protein [Candidatus Berkelbacteria bacterium]
MSRESLVGVRAPELVGNDWLNSEPLTLKKLLDDEKTVLIDFWTYSCINCLRTMPHLKDWWTKYQDKGLVIIGVHSPEFDFEKEPKNILAAMKDLNITWPILNDADHLTWKAYNNHYWPRHLLLNHQGKIIYDHIGEGNYPETEAAIQQTLSEDQGRTDLPKVNSVDHQHKLGAVCHPINPETYLGSNRGHIKNKETASFIDPKTDQPGISLDGDWKIEDKFIVPGPQAKPTDYVSLIFSATEVNLVGRADQKPVKLKITLNDLPLATDTRGADILEEKGETWLELSSPRMYQVIKSDRYLSPAELKIEVTEAGFRLYVFTFGGCTDS